MKQNLRAQSTDLRNAPSSEAHAAQACPLGVFAPRWDQLLPFVQEGPSRLPQDVSKKFNQMFEFGSRFWYSKGHCPGMCSACCDNGGSNEPKSAINKKLTFGLSWHRVCGGSFYGVCGFGCFRHHRCLKPLASASGFACQTPMWHFTLVS